jgi:hypothetical protein
LSPAASVGVYRLKYGDTDRSLRLSGVTIRVFRA